MRTVGTPLPRRAGVGLPAPGEQPGISLNGDLLPRSRNELERTAPASGGVAGRPPHRPLSAGRPDSRGLPQRRSRYRRLRSLLRLGRPLGGSEERHPGRTSAEAVAPRPGRTEIPVRLRISRAGTSAGRHRRRRHLSPPPGGGRRQFGGFHAHSQFTTYTGVFL